MAKPEDKPAATIDLDDAFDPLEFWIRHKQRIIMYSGLLVAGLLIFGLYQYNQQRKIVTAEAAFLQAKTADDFQKLISGYPESPSAGTAYLRLAELQRKDGKYDASTQTLHTFTEKFPKHPLL